jgi:hypothetical protein
MALSNQEFQKLLASKKKAKVDLSTAEGLATYARSLGLEDQVNKITSKPKLSLLGRLGKGLGAFNPAEAVLTGQEKGVGAGIAKYATGIVQGIGSALTGTDYEGERRTFSDIAEKYGVTNGIAKFGLGFLGDVLLDPTTYFGGAIAKGIVQGTKIGAKVGLKGISKVSPAVGEGLEMSAKGLQDAFGAAFVSGYKASKGAPEGILSKVNVRTKKLIDYAGLQLSNFGIKGLTKEQLREVAVKTVLGKQSEFLLGEELGSRSLATKIIEGKKGVKLTSAQEGLLAKTKVKFDNPLQQEYFNKQQESIKQFAKLGGVEDPYAVYYPMLKPQVKNKVLREIKNQGIEAGSRNWNKKFNNVLKEENIDMDIQSAFFRRGAEIITSVENKEILENFVMEFGKPLNFFKDEQIAKQAGFKLLRDNGGFGKAIGYVGEWDKKLFDDLIRPEFQTINMLAKATGFDAVTSLFKRSVTGLFLPFHVRNWVSGIIQNFEVLGAKSLLPSNMANGFRIAKASAQDIAPKGNVILNGIEKSWKEVFDPFNARFSGDTFYNNEFNQAVESGADTLKSAQKILSKGTLKQTIKNPLSQEAAHFKFARATGQFIEHQQKATAYITALDSGKTVQEALQLAEMAGFDYRRLTQFESQIMRRIVPFYSFTRKNIELQLKTLGENPQRINQIMKFIENIGEKPTEEEKAGLPGYIQEGFVIKFPDSVKGLKQYITSLGTPIEQFTGLFKQKTIMGLISQMNPILKTPIEIGIGKDSFRQKDLKDTYDAKEYKFAPQVLKDLLQLKEVEKKTYKKVGDKLIPTGTYTQYVADPERLLIARSLFTSRGVSYLDQVFDNNLQGFAKFVNLFTGVKAKEFDIELGKALKDKDQRRALEDLVTKYSDTKVFQKLYQSD